MKRPTRYRFGSAGVPLGLCLLTAAVPALASVPHSAPPSRSLLVLPEADPARPVVPRQFQEVLPAGFHGKGQTREQRRERFLTVLLPLVLAENERLEQLRQTIAALLVQARSAAGLPEGSAVWLRDLATEYRVSGDPLTDTRASRELLARVDQVPASLALAQAAIETGWGSSGAARRDRDLFGMSAVISQGAKRRNKERKGRGGPRFLHLADSVRAYMHNLNTHSAYRSLRSLRAKARVRGATPDGGELAAGLTRYSQLGQSYVKQIRGLIRSAALARYDLARLEPGSGLGETLYLGLEEAGQGRGRVR